jgi:hypothetical protein
VTSPTYSQGQEFFSDFFRQCHDFFEATELTVTVTKATQRTVRYRDRCSPTHRDSISIWHVPSKNPVISEANRIPYRTNRRQCPDSLDYYQLSPLGVRLVVDQVTESDTVHGSAALFTTTWTWGEADASHGITRTLHFLFTYLSVFVVCCLC